MLSTGMQSAAASVGLSLLWDVDVGLSHIDKYTYSSEEYIKVSLLSPSGPRCQLTPRLTSSPAHF